MSDTQREATKHSVSVNAKDVGNYFTDSEGRLWKMVGYVAEPQATFERMDGDLQYSPFSLSGAAIRDRRTHVVGCPNYHDMNLRRLVVKDD